MSDELIVKLAAALPKGEANGLGDYATSEEAFRKKIQHRYDAPKVALVVIGVREAKAGKDGIDTVTHEILRVEPVTTTEGRRQAEQMLIDEYAARTGQGVLPFDLSQLSKAAFADLPKTAEQIDQAQEREREHMSPLDELRRHLEIVHGTKGARTLTDTEAEEEHRKDHDGGQLPEALAHEPDWHGWSRADLEQAEIETDDLPDAVAAVADAPAEDQPTLFDDDAQGDFPTNEEIEGPDPDLGKDLDDEDDTDR